MVKYTMTTINLTSIYNSNHTCQLRYVYITATDGNYIYSLHSGHHM